MNPPQKSALQQINLRALRLELLMRAHEVSRRIDERVRRALLQAKPVAAAPESVATTDQTPIPATAENGSECGRRQLARQMQVGATTGDSDVARGG